MSQYGCDATLKTLIIALDIQHFSSSAFLFFALCSKLSALSIPYVLLDAAIVRKMVATKLIRNSFWF
jgi:hypothetical protein